ncbi:MAG: helix-turn-helix domain-containing protein [Actinobacteria bacterium]|nr:helix-turn-helix domain-containing protein [Actinomycetota bacterium]
MSDVQALVDALAAELRRPTGVDDRHFRAIAYSSQPEEVDSVRLASILQREAPPAVREWLEELGVHAAETYLRVPANPELGMVARICVPLRFDGMPLGYLWLIDEPEPLSDEQLREAGRYAEEFGIALYRARLLERDDRRRERELVRQLIGLREGDPTAAGEELVRAGHLVQAKAYAVLTVDAARADGGEVPDAVRVRLVDAAEQVRRAVPPHHLLVLVDAGGVILVLASASSEETGRRAQALAGFARSPQGAEWRAVVGVSGARSEVAGLGGAYREARAAGRVAAAIGREEEVARWEELGAYRTVVAMLGDREPSEQLPASLRRLLDSADGDVLIETLERFLDLGGDARAAAERLFIHRSSLYGRLHRIEEIAAVDLRSGEDRLELHLAIRLWRLGGSQSAHSQRKP